MYLSSWRSWFPFWLLTYWLAATCWSLPPDDAVEQGGVFWRHPPACLRDLPRLGVGADLILRHRSGRRGCSEMTLHKKDPDGRLCGIHNERTWYDHTRDWVTHASLQTQVSNFTGCGITACALWAVRAQGQAQADGGAGARRVPLLDDTRLEQGVIVWSPAGGRHVRQGVLDVGDRDAEPKWGLAQWHSRFTLAGAAAQSLPDGEVHYSDGAKSITFFPAGGEADFALALNGNVEYSGHAPAKGDPWPHLLAERELLVQPALDTLSAVPFGVRYRLVRAAAHSPPGFDERRHTAQFVFYITVQNRNQDSAGFGDYFWFGVPLYDARYRLPRAHKAVDVGSDRKPATGKFIFNPGGEAYTRQSAHDGQWVTIDCDLLPLIRTGLDTAWQRGYLADSRHIADYRLVGMNTGWEVTGPWDVEMQVAGLRLAAELRTANDESTTGISRPMHTRHSALEPIPAFCPGAVCW